MRYNANSHRISYCIRYDKNNKEDTIKYKKYKIALLGENKVDLPTF